MTPVFFVLLSLSIIISASLMGILLHNGRRQKKNERLNSGFEDAAAEYELSIRYKEVLRNSMIGLDDAKNRLLFLTLAGNKLDGYLVDLEEVKSSKVTKTYGTNKNGKYGVEVYINMVALQLNYKNNAKPLILPFYIKATDHKSILRKREEQARDWENIISGRLTKNSRLLEFHKNQVEYDWLG